MMQHAFNAGIKNQRASGRKLLFTRFDKSLVIGSYLSFKWSLRSISPVLVLLKIPSVMQYLNLKEKGYEAPVQRVLGYCTFLTWKLLCVNRYSIMFVWSEVRQESLPLHVVLDSNMFFYSTAVTLPQYVTWTLTLHFIRNVTLVGSYIY